MGKKPNRTIKLCGILTVCSVCLVGCGGPEVRGRSFSAEELAVPAVKRPQSFGQRATSDERPGSHIRIASKPVLVNVQVDVGHESDREYVYRILGEIEKRGWSATVYFTGEFALEHPDIVKDIHDRKHQIAVGGWTVGEDLTLLSYQEQLDFISESFTAVRKAINNFHNAYIADFRPQGLKQNNETFNALQQLHVRSNAGFLASETKIHPYHTDYGFIAIPIATVKQGSEDIPLIDDVIFLGGTSVQNHLGYLRKRYDESLVTKEPFSIVVHPSVTGSDRAKLEMFAQFLDYVKDTNGQIAMTDFMTTQANPFMTDLKLFVDPNVNIYSGRDVPIRGSYYANCDCPNYYIRIYGKYPCDVSWQPLDGGKFFEEEPPLGKREFSRLITIPYSPCNDLNYMLLAVGRACHGDCWPTQDSYEQKYELKLRLKNPRAGERINGIERTDVPGVDRYCPGRGQCVELKPGDLIFREWQPWVNTPPIVVRGPFEHAGIYVGNGWILESVPESGVRLNRIYLFDNFDAPWKSATTVVGFKGLCPCDEKELRQEIVKEASWYYYNHTPFAKDAVQFLNPNPQKGQPLQCGQFVYMAYKPFKYDLRNFLGWWWPAIAPVDVRSMTSGEIEGSGGLGHDSYSRRVDPVMEIWPQPTIRKIYPGGAFSENVFVDPAISMIVFALGWEHNSSSLLLTIYDPDGIAVSDGDIVHGRDEQLGGEYYIIETPKTGNWTMQVAAVNVPEEGENYTLSNYFASDLNIMPILGKQWYSPGEPVPISANISDSGLSITDVNFVAEVFRPDGSSSVVTLYDDGSHGDIQSNDGVYSGLFAETSAEGTYNIRIDATGAVAGSRFERESYESLSVRRQTAEIISCLDSGSDTSGDGLYEQLGLNVFVNIIEPVDYRLTASLYDSNMALIDRVSEETHLDAGWFRRVRLDFAGMAICEHKVNGPYRVDVGIYDVNGIQMDYKEGYSTAPYRYRDFQCGGQITGIITDPNGQPVEGAFLQITETGDTILSDNFNDNRLSPTWSRWPPGPRFSVSETGGEIRIGRVSSESGWNNLQYAVPVNQDVEASIRVRTPNLPEGTGFSFFVFKGGPGSQYGGPEWGCYRISRGDEEYRVSGIFEGKDYWDSGSSVGLFGDEAQNFHTYKIICEKSKKRMAFFIDDICICTIQDVNFINFEFNFGADCWNLGMDADMDVRVDDFLVKEFVGFTPVIKGTAFTDPNGAYATNRLFPATYEISVLPPEGANLLRDSAVVVLDKDETEMANFILKEGGTVSGRVCDPNGVPVSGAYVEASGPEHATSATDPNGIYELTGLESKTYDISVSPSPYANLMEAATTVQAVRGETKITDFTLQPAGSIAGRVTDANGTPITNVYLFLSGEEMPRYSVDKDGRYVIPGLHAGTYTINTDAVETEFVDASKTVNVKLGQTTTADFVLRKGRVFVQISGYVMNTSGDPLHNVSVEIGNVYNGMNWVDTTDKDGYFEFTGLSVGSYGISVNDWPRLSEYTIVELNDENAVNVTEDLVMYFTLWRIGINVAVDSSHTYVNGDTIDVELTTTNNDVKDLVGWEAMVELGRENDGDEVLDSKSFPISVAARETKAVIVTLKIPEDNIYSELYVAGEIRNNNWTVNSNIGLLNAKTKQDLQLDGIIKVRERAAPKPLNVTKTVSGEAQGQIARVDGNAPFTYTICFDNNDNNFPVTDVSVVDILPDEVSFVSSDADKAGGRYDPAVHTYTWSYGFLESGADMCLDLVVKVNPGVAPGTTITNTVIVDSSETPPSTASIDAMVYKAGGAVSR